MSLDASRQTITTQLPLSFARFQYMSSYEEIPEAMSLADRLKIIIQEMPGPDRGKQVRLAKIADESKQLVNHWLRGVTTEIRYPAAKRIADQLGYRVDWLMLGKGPMRKDDKDEVAPTPETMALVYLTSEEQQIITNYRATDEIGRQVIQGAAARMKKS
jgi:hypothetical protein